MSIFKRNIRPGSKSNPAFKKFNETADKQYWIEQYCRTYEEFKDREQELLKELAEADEQNRKLKAECDRLFDQCKRLYHEFAVTHDVYAGDE